MLMIQHVRVNDCFKINGKQRIKKPKKGEYVRFKIYERKKNNIYRQCRFMNLAAEDNGKQAPDES